MPTLRACVSLLPVRCSSWPAAFYAGSFGGLPGQSRNLVVLRSLAKGKRSQSLPWRQVARSSVVPLLTPQCRGTGARRIYGRAESGKGLWERHLGLNSADHPVVLFQITYKLSELEGLVSASEVERSSLGKLYVFVVRTMSSPSLSAIIGKMLVRGRFGWPSLPLKFTPLPHPFEVGKKSTSRHRPHKWLPEAPILSFGPLGVHWSL